MRGPRPASVRDAARIEDDVRNKVVACYVDGRMLKGSTHDFVPTKDVFHVVAADAGPGASPVRVQIRELKAVFFVRDFAGNPAHRRSNEFAEGRPVTGRRIEVTFADGERLVGTTQGYQPNRPGFFVVPADQNANIERCFVVSAATTRVTLL